MGHTATPWAPSLLSRSPSWRSTHSKRPGSLQLCLKSFLKFGDDRQPLRLNENPSHVCSQVAQRDALLPSAALSLAESFFCNATLWSCGLLLHVNSRSLSCKHQAQLCCADIPLEAEIPAFTHPLLSIFLYIGLQRVPSLIQISIHSSCTLHPQCIGTSAQPCPLG